MRCFLRARVSHDVSRCRPSPEWLDVLVIGGGVKKACILGIHISNEVTLWGKVYP